MHKHVFTVLLIGAAGSQLGSTDCGQVLRDPGFDLWCGDSLCAWKVERGDIMRVPTWHEADAGVALLGNDTAIEQLAPVNSGDSDCIKFDLVANIDDTAEVYLNVDLEGDGTIEMSERLPTAHWKPLSYEIYIEGAYDGVRFELAKRGSGSAVLAQIGATTTTNCEGLTPIKSGPRPDGARCNGPADCASGVCVITAVPDGWLGLGQICMGCDPQLGANACSGGEVCGIGDPLQPILEVPAECVPAGSHVLGEPCRVDAECASAQCVMSYCSACGGTSGPACPTGESCLESWPRLTEGPFVCGAGSQKGLPGDPCGTNNDCKSKLCRGTPRSECLDGRACTTSADCPVMSGLDPGPCTMVGIQGGSCE